MILFDLLCSQGHGFEAWFRDSDSFDRLSAIGEIECTLCGDTKVKKALMAPNISTPDTAAARRDRDKAEESAAFAPPAGDGEAAIKSDAGTTAAGAMPSMTVQENSPPLSGNRGLPVPEKVAEAMQVLRQVQTHIEKTFDHVGKQFAEEARKMHYGESEKRSIYGEATKEEAKELAEEGIEIDQMPWLTSRNS